MKEKTRQLHEFFWLALGSLISQRLVLLTRKKERKNRASCLLVIRCLTSNSCRASYALSTTRLLNISSAEVRQSDLNKLVVWSENWQMAFNAGKCFLLRGTRSRDNVVNYTYTTMGQPITSVTRRHKYLGVELDSKLTWNEHISAITGKPNSSLCFLRRNLYNCPEQIKTQAYYSLVRPNLEYACSVWDPHTQKNIQSIEKVQPRAARFVKKCNQRTPGTITSLLEELKWLSLEQRRKQTKLTNLYNIVNGSQKERQTRNYHPLKFINAGCRTNIYKYSFFPDPLKNGTNFPKQLLKQPTQRPSSFPWRPRPGPIEHLNTFYFFITSKIHCTVF